MSTATNKSIRLVSNDTCDSSKKKLMLILLKIRKDAHCCTDKSTAKYYLNLLPNLLMIMPIVALLKYAYHFLSSYFKCCLNLPRMSPATTSNATSNATSISL